MKTNHIIILSLAVFAVCLLTTPQQCLGEDKWEEEDVRRGEMRREEDIRRSLIGRHKMWPEKIEKMLQHIAERNPEKAEELKILRKENPREFRKAMRQMFAEKRGRKKDGKGFKGHEKRDSSYGCPDKERSGDKCSKQDRSDRSKRDRSGRSKRDRWSDRATHDQTLSWLKENYPEKAEKLAKLREKKPELFGRIMRKYSRIAETAKENPELAKVLKQDLELKGKKYKILKKLKNATDEKQKQQLTTELKEVISNRFDNILKRKQAAYDKMLKKLEKLKKEVEKHKTELEKHNDPDFKNKNVNARLQKLVEQTEEFKWD